MRSLLLTFFVLSLVVTVWMGKDLWVEAQTYSWKEVPAIVTQSAVKTVATLKGTNRNLQPSERHWYQYDLLYEYRIDGVDHASGKLGLIDTPVLNRSAADSLAARYPVGGSVTAYVSPDDPDMAVLEPGLTPLTVVLFVAGLLAALVAGRMALIPEPRKRRRLPSV
ncbi:MAG: DUF3592 domain-containing protein [Tabrizicola sp.]|jgi:hypothetical protein|nr:DUF3592 domain-containing protein [Tabrizicola sp.]